MSDVAETVVAAQEPEVVEAAPSEEQPEETPVVPEEKTEETTENGDVVAESEEKTEEASATPVEETTEAGEQTAQNGEAKDTNGNDRKRVSSAHEAEETEEDVPAVKKTKVDDEVDAAAAGDAPAPVATAAE